MKEEYLFVYGTLMSGYDDKTSHSYLAKYGEFVGKATVQAKMFMIDYYPGIVQTKEKSIARGELYKITDSEALFSFLDKYEEYLVGDSSNSEFIREKITVKLNSSGKEYDSWAYFYNKDTDDLEVLPKGDFLNEYHK